MNFLWNPNARSSNKVKSNTFYKLFLDGVKRKRLGKTTKNGTVLRNSDGTIKGSGSFQNSNSTKHYLYLESKYLYQGQNPVGRMCVLT